MGRKRKRNRPLIPEIESEKQCEKTRKTILKVFRARLSNPDGGGALLVGKDTKNTFKSCSTTTHSSFSSHDRSDTSSMSDSVDSSVNDSQRQTRTKRKRKSKRRAKTKVLSKVQNEKSDVSRHLRAAHGIRGIPPLRSHETVDKGQDKISVITLNRLTNKVGLFNNGRKSETISREIPVSESLKKKTADDLKKILEQSHESSSSVAIDIDPPSPNRTDFLHENKKCGHTSSARRTATLSTGLSVDRQIVLSSGGHSHHSAKAAGTSITPASEPRLATSVGSISCKSTGSAFSEDEFPETPPYKEIAVDLMHTLKPRQIFLGRSLLEETRMELQKLMRQNVPRSATPTPNLDKLGSTCMGSVKRSLLDRFPPKEHPTQDTSNPNSYVQLQENDSTASDQNLCETKPPTAPSVILTDANVLLKCNDLAIREAEHKYSPLPNKEKNKNFNPDARNILLHNDSERARKLTTISHSDIHFDCLHDSGSQSNMTAKKQAYINLDPGISMDTGALPKRDSQSSHYGSQSSWHSSQSSSHSHHERSSRHYSNVVVSNKAVVTEMHHYPEPHLLSAGYYHDSLNGLVHQDAYDTTHPAKYQLKPSMDFLDMLDDKLIDPSLPRLKSATPDSDGSPLWLPVPPPYLRKPKFNTPSPPDIYPRRLY